MNQLRQQLMDISKAALDAVDPYTSIKNALSYDGEYLELRTVDGCKRWMVSAMEHVWIVGCGKAGTPMTLAIEDLLGDFISGGSVTVKYDHIGDRRPSLTTLVEAGHPHPDQQGVSGAAQALKILDSAGPKDLVVAVISGGGSALWPQPVEGVSLQDKQDVTKLLLRCGADIHEINTIRKHLSQIKGGQAARKASQAFVLVLCVSDVIGDNLDVIASGPFAPDTSTFAEANAIVDKYQLGEKLPGSVRAHIQKGLQGAIEDTPKEGAAEFRRVTHCLCATNALALAAAKKTASDLGYAVTVIEEPLCGEAKDAAKEFCEQAAALHKECGKPIALIAGGETTIDLGENPGKGGRNQEFAVAAAQYLREYDNAVVVSLGTDGTDGPTDAAGGFADSGLIERAHAAGLDFEGMLASHSVYDLLKETGDLLITGPTNTNVMDIQIALFR